MLSLKCRSNFSRSLPSRHDSSKPWHGQSHKVNKKLMPQTLELSQFPMLRRAPHTRLMVSLNEHRPLPQLQTKRALPRHSWWVGEEGYDLQQEATLGAFNALGAVQCMQRIKGSCDRIYCVLHTRLVKTISHSTALPRNWFSELRIIKNESKQTTHRSCRSQYQFQTLDKVIFEE